MINIGTIVKIATASPNLALYFRPLEASKAKPPRIIKLRIRFKVSGSMAAMEGYKPPR